MLKNKRLSKFDKIIVYNPAVPILGNKRFFIIFMHKNNIFKNSKKKTKNY